MIGHRRASASLHAAGWLGFAALSACSPSPTPGASSAPRAAAVASVPPALAPTGPLREDQLSGYVDSARAYKPKDEFAKGFDDSPLLGRSFKITIPYEKNVRGPIVRYDADKEELTVLVSLESNLHNQVDANRPLSLSYIVLQKDSDFGSEVAASNAFGATTTVTPVSYKVAGIGVAGWSFDPRGIGALLPGKSDRYGALEKTIKASPDRARAIADGMVMDVEGEVVKSVRNHAIECLKADIPATTSYKYEEHWDECVISVRLSRIAIRSRDIGTIANWDARNG